jgi:hypothetical protein
VIANDTLRVCLLPSAINASLNLPASFNAAGRPNRAYAIVGRVDVGTDAGGDASAPRAGSQRGVLTIEPGVLLFGSQGLDYIVVNRGSQMIANGNATRPIVFTSRADLVAPASEDRTNAIGEWGGLVLLGRAPINNCPGSTTPGSATCEAQVEGTNAFFGGNATADSSGSLNFVRVQHSGFRILENNELNGITLAGVGAGTSLSNIQVHNSSDDGIEWFGGTVNGRYLVLTGNDDDSLDTDQGYNGNNQFIIAIQRAGGGDRIWESSNVGGAARTPVSNPRFANFTAIGTTRTGAGDSLTLNTATSNVFLNGVVTLAAGAANACLDIDDADTRGRFESVYLSCPIPFRDDSNVNAAATAAIFNAGSNNVSNGTSTLTNTFVNGPNESGRSAFSGLTGVNSFFQSVTYIGAVRDASDTWWQGWTCSLPGQPVC